MLQSMGSQRVEHDLETDNNKVNTWFISCCSVAKSCLTLCNPMNCSTPGFSVYHCLPEFAQTQVHWVSDVIQPSHPVIPFSSCPQFFPASKSFPMRPFFIHIRWPKYWSFSFSISPSNEHSGLISFRIDWFDLLAVQGTLQSLFQHHSSKASIFQHSAFIMVQLSHPYMTAAKTIPLTIQTFVHKSHPLNGSYFILGSKTVFLCFLFYPLAPNGPRRNM